MTSVDLQEIVQEIQTTYLADQVWNPIDMGRLRRLAAYVGLEEGGTVLDLGCGTGAMLREWAARWPISGTGVDLSDAFIRRASELAEKSDIAHRISFKTADVHTYYPAAPFDVVSCIGAADAFGGTDKALERMVPMVRSGGGILLGDIQRNGLAEPIATASRLGLRLAGLVCSSEDGWDTYYSNQWSAAHSWCRANPGRPEGPKLLERMKAHQESYLQEERGTLLWCALALIKAE